MYLEVYLDGGDGFEGTYIYINFEITITGCVITKLVLDEPVQDTFFYDIQVPGVNQYIMVPNYTVKPDNCPGGDKNGLSFELEQQPASPKVSFYWDEPYDELLFNTEDPDDFGVLLITLKISPASPSQV